MSKSQANSLNVKQCFSGSTTLGGRQTAMIECIRRHGPMTAEALVESMGLRTKREDGNTAPPAATIGPTVASLKSRGLVVVLDMTEKQAERHREQCQRGPIPKLYSLTTDGLSIRRALGNVEGTGRNLGVIATNVPCPSPVN